MNKLTPKQELFCLEYTVCRNATQAAIKAGYARSSARQQAARMLSKDNIKARVAGLFKEATKRTEITLDNIMSELKSIAFANTGDFINWTSSGVHIVPKGKLTAEKQKAVESIWESQDKNGGKMLRIRLHSKLRALEGLIRLIEVVELKERIEKLEDKIESRGDE